MTGGLSGSSGRTRTGSPHLSDTSHSLRHKDTYKEIRDKKKNHQIQLIKHKKLNLKALRYYRFYNIHDDMNLYEAGEMYFAWPTAEGYLQCVFVTI